MIAAKSGNWWETDPQRGGSNNSAVLMRHKVTKEFFMDLWKRVELSGSGEPGIYLNNDKDWGTNPCCEIALRETRMFNMISSHITIFSVLNFYVSCAFLITNQQTFGLSQQ